MRNVSSIVSSPIHTKNFRYVSIQRSPARNPRTNQTGKTQTVSTNWTIFMRNGSVVFVCVNVCWFNRICSLYVCVSPITPSFQIQSPPPPSLLPLLTPTQSNPFTLSLYCRWTKIAQPPQWDGSVTMKKKKQQGGGVFFHSGKLQGRKLHPPAVKKWSLVRDKFIADAPRWEGGVHPPPPLISYVHRHGGKCSAVFSLGDCGGGVLCCGKKETVTVQSARIQTYFTIFRADCLSKSQHTRATPGSGVWNICGVHFQDSAEAEK